MSNPLIRLRQLIVDVYSFESVFWRLVFLPEETRNG